MPQTSPDRRHECDLIMKGGITSGVVYPEAVLKLHEKYDFKCIGGASAGAIAAAATAAAQYAGVTTPAGPAARPGSGFAGLAALNGELGQRGKILELFQPTGNARALLEVFLAGLRGAHKGKGWKKAAWAALHVSWALVAQTPLALLLGAAAGILILSVLACAVDGSGRSAPSLCAAAAIAGALLGALVQLLSILFLTLPRQGFGICRLHVPETTDPAAKLPLTDWLFRRFDEIAGFSAGRPLTFGDLSERDLRLELITTNLSELRPYTVPLQTHRFLFRRSEFEDYFPAYAVEHMVKTSYQSSSVVPPAGFFFLPPARDLPIAFGARLSLSFPVLISAVPLYSIKAAAFSRKAGTAPLALEDSDLKRNWFSDGGICSNFPIHFFDHWLPNRPTFGISLGTIPAEQVTTVTRPLEGMQEGTTVAVRRPEEDVHLPKANRPEAAAWHDFASLAGFFSSIFDTMMEYRDTMQSELPGFRERIVEIRLTPDEGGLNLDMEPTRIEKLADKGRRAGALLKDTFDFEEHRWVRLQVLMPPLAAELERLLVQKQGGWPAAGKPYPRPQNWTAAMQSCLDALAQTAAGGALRPLERDDPRPPVTLRATPRI
ncbi:MAG TPA: hypothetical protein VFL36_20205 [Myxococcales bacterium]|nr:hypothetical protein [Myxococcales bacterium]